MNSSATYNFQRYLSAKRSVDDRSINAHVWKTLVKTIDEAKFPSPLQVLEVGSGIGTMVERGIEWGLLQQVEYTALDSEPENFTETKKRLNYWCEKNNFKLQNGHGDTLTILGKDKWISVHLVTVDLLDFIRHIDGKRNWDLIIAHAFLDLVDLPARLPEILNLLKPGGLFYFAINFDGLTHFEPVIDDGLDQLIMVMYHKTMENHMIDGRSFGDSQCGRHLFSHLNAAGAIILAAGASDWVVFPHSGGYPADEAYFLHFIIHTIEQALIDYQFIDNEMFSNWIAERHLQVDRQELVYIAHQLDFIGRLK